MDDAAEAGPEKGGEMTKIRTRGAGSRWRRKEKHGGTWGRPLPSSVALLGKGLPQVPVQVRAYIIIILLEVK